VAKLAALRWQENAKSGKGPKAGPEPARAASPGPGTAPAPETTGSTRASSGELPEEAEGPGAVQRRSPSPAAMGRSHSWQLPELGGGGGGGGSAAGSAPGGKPERAVIQVSCLAWAGPCASLTAWHLLAGGPRTCRCPPLGQKQPPPLQQVGFGRSFRDEDGEAAGGNNGDRGHHGPGSVASMATTARTAKTVDRALLYGATDDATRPFNEVGGRCKTA
jgi:hypothetical protein